MQSPRSCFRGRPPGAGRGDDFTDGATIGQVARRWRQGLLSFDRPDPAAAAPRNNGADKPQD